MVGIIKRVPKETLIELDNIKKEYNIIEDHKAFDEMRRLSEFGREMKKLDFFYPMKRRRK